MRVVLAFVLFGFSLSDKASFQSNVNRIAEHLKQTGLSGEDYNIGLAMGNRLYAEHMFTSLAKLDPADEDVASTFTQMRTIFQTIKDLLTSARDTAQTGLDAANLAIAACPNTATHDNVATLNAAIASTDATLQACHTSEDGTNDATDSSCNIYLNTISTLTNAQPQYCVLPAHDFMGGSDMQTVIDWIADGKTWFTTHQTTFLTQSAACNTDHAAADTQNGQCRTDQHNYEQAICSAHNAATTMCATETTCYDNAVAAHNTLVPTALADANQRVTDGVMIHYVDCLVQNLQDNADQSFAAWEAACSGVQNDATIPPLYNNTFPALDAMAVCDDTVNSGVIPDGASGTFGSTTYATAISNLNILVGVVGTCP
jgi:hypothetical protein